MTPTTVKAAGPAEFLSLIPRMLGYRPAQSLVLIPFHGSSSLGAMRFDLPDSGSDEIDSVASTVIGMTCRLPEADGVAVIVYSGIGFAETGGMPHRALCDALERRADACGLRLTDALCVAADGWGSYLDPTCPAAGRALAELGAAGSALADLAGLPEPDGDQVSGAALPDTDLAARERVARSLAAIGRAVTVLCGEDFGERGSGAGGIGGASRHVIGEDGVSEDGDRGDAAAAAAKESARRDLAPVPGPVTGEGEEAASVPEEKERVDPQALATVCRLDDLPGLFEDALEWDPDALEPFEAAALVWCLSRPSLRDVALVQWSGNLSQGDEALDAQLRWESGEEYPAHLAMRMWGEGERPSPDRLEAALRLARQVAAVAPRASRPGPLAMCAWLSWSLGRSTHAEAYASEACVIEPEHGLSEIVRSFVRAGHLPDWAFHRAGGR
jgi:hypothetical protein